MAKLGRPSSYTQEIADKICEQLAIGYSIRTVCKGEDMPSVETFFRWLRSNESFREQYARAKQESADAMAEEILDISDDVEHDKEAINKARLRVDTRKFLMAKMKPKKYGDKLDVTSDGKALPTPIIPLPKKEE